MDLYAKDRANGEGSLTAKERARERSNIGKDSPQAIEVIDDLISQNEIILENFFRNIKATPTASKSESRVESSSKGKKRKGVDDDYEIQVLKEGLDSVAEAIREGNSILKQICPRAYSSDEIFNEIVNLGVEENKQIKAYRFLNAKDIRVEDCVLMRPVGVGKPPYVTQIEKNEADGRHNVKVRVRWYSRPEESIGERRQFHGAIELFLSDHHDVQSAHTIEGKCTTHSFKNYTKIENVGTDDYFCRFEYKAATGAFIPDRVAVYCKCEMPYNPDDLMVTPPLACSCSGQLMKLGGFGLKMIQTKGAAHSASPLADGKVRVFSTGVRACAA
ncbi:Chromatin remodeling protein EBS [Bienertia sinuspersici]